MKFKEGDIVSVKISHLNVPGVVKKLKRTGEYVVQFDGGAESVVLERHMKPGDSTVSKDELLNSPSRRSPSRRSPGRTTSPARRTRASPSPSRRRSPSRKSQPRILKVSLKNSEPPEESSPNLSFPRRRKPIEQTIDWTANEIYREQN